MCDLSFLSLVGVKSHSSAPRWQFVLADLKTIFDPLWPNTPHPTQIHTLMWHNLSPPMEYTFFSFAGREIRCLHYSESWLMERGPLQKKKQKKDRNQKRQKKKSKSKSASEKNSSTQKLRGKKSWHSFCYPNDLDSEKVYGQVDELERFRVSLDTFASLLSLDFLFFVSTWNPTLFFVTPSKPPGSILSILVDELRWDEHSILLRWRDRNRNQYMIPYEGYLLRRVIPLYHSHGSMK